MTYTEAIKIIERLLVEHRQTHVNWSEFFTRNPHREKEFMNTAGGRHDQQNAIDSYDKALEAVNVLKEERDEV